VAFDLPFRERPARRVWRQFGRVETKGFGGFLHGIGSPLEGLSFLLFRQRGAVHKKQIALHGGPKRLSVRAVKGAFFAFTGAKRKPLTEEADGQEQPLARKGNGEDGLVPKENL
jgi:hypothetical protein